MQLTEFSIFSSEELCEYILSKESGISELEVELAQRMLLMIDLMIENGIYT